MGSIAHPRLFRSLCGGALGAALALAPLGGVPSAAADLLEHGDLAPAVAELPLMRGTHSVAQPGLGRLLTRPWLTSPRPAPAVAERGRTGALRAGWSRPVSRSPISAPYGVEGDWAAGHHTGVDFAVPIGTTVYSIGAGTVTFAGRAGAYGKTVKVRMRDGHYVLYAHLSRISVGYGAMVSAGTVIGASGASGRTTGPHLHLEVRTGPFYGSDIDPVAYLAARGVRLT